ncbi:unnamed protein product [Acanthoscelides obtectus]|uniref:Nuclease HARBI1 n=1 Tax=Acanthoscelides obtectus TaxID=200917 RepID=A0A9P0KNR0_ACAOB|nr:unnamed protein product [Acanthoscelides obtectus]CAK1641656.1 hypothetical protein AOBTE_LOCUS12534 [Acanthoscelides obtectus]
MEIEECIAVWYLLNNKKKKLKRRRSLWVHPMLGLRESKGTYLATGCSLTELHYNYRVGISTASEIIQETCKLIWIFMKEQCIPKPTREKWLEIADGFLKNANYPHCLGAIDGKHIRLDPHEYLVQARLQMVFHFPEELVYYHLELNFPHL